MSDSLLGAGVYWKEGKYFAPLVKNAQSFEGTINLPEGLELQLAVHADLLFDYYVYDQPIFSEREFPDSLSVSLPMPIGQILKSSGLYLKPIWKEWGILLGLALLGILIWGMMLWGKYPAGLSLREKIPLPPVRAAYDRLLWGGWIGVLVFMIGTAIFHQYYRSIGLDWHAGGSIKHFLIQFDLTRENVTATWFSSTLLMLAGTISIIIALRAYGQLAVWQRFIWIGMGLAFLGLSADEVGSIHERVFVLNYLFESTAKETVQESMLSRLLILGSLLVVGVIGIWGLWSRLKDDRLATVLFVVGLLCLGSIPFQEKFEMASFRSAEDPELWLRPIWQMILEEGAELVGIMSFLTAFIRLRVREQDSRSQKVEHFSAGWGFGLLVLIPWAGVGVVMSRVFLEYILKFGDDGVLANWFGGVVYLGLGMLVCGVIFHQEKPLIFDRYLFVVGGMSLVLCLYYGANMRAWGHIEIGAGLRARHLMEALLVLAGLMTTWLAGRVKSTRQVWIEPGIATTCLAILLWLDPGITTGYDLLPSLFWGLSIFRYFQSFRNEVGEREVFT